MNILSFYRDGGMLRVFTDNPVRSEFVYEIDRFDSFAELTEEINNSCAQESAVALIKSDKFKLLSDSLVSAGAVDDTKTKGRI